MYLATVIDFLWPITNYKFLAVPVASAQVRGILVKPENLACRQAIQELRKCFPEDLAQFIFYLAKSKHEVKNQWNGDYNWERNNFKCDDYNLGTTFN